MYCIFACQGSQLFRDEREDLRYALITKYATPETVDTPLTLIFRVRQGACHCSFSQ